jgi:hypothetical protein
MAHMKVIIFNGYEVGQLTAEINAWLAKSPTISINEMLQSESIADDRGWSLTITIFYLD